MILLSKGLHANSFIWTYKLTRLRSLRSNWIYSLTSWIYIEIVQDIIAMFYHKLMQCWFKRLMWYDIDVCCPWRHPVGWFPGPSWRLRRGCWWPDGMKGQKAARPPTTCYNRYTHHGLVIIGSTFFKIFCPFVRGIHRSPVDSPRKGTVIYKVFSMMDCPHKVTVICKFFPWCLYKISHVCYHCPSATSLLPTIDA